MSDVTLDIAGDGVHEEKYYYNLTTGEVVKGKADGWSDRMGPYDSEQQAREALELAQKRTEQADEYDRDGGWGDD